jgi:plastocyanin
MRAIAVALVAAALLAGCGGGGGASQPAGSIKVTMTEYGFEPSTISAPSGKVVFYLVNAGKLSHDMIIRDKSTGARVPGAASELVSAGDTFVFTVSNLAAGTYGFFCDQPGHETLGMIGTLTLT